MLGPGVEHQDGVIARVRVEHGERRALSLVREVEIAVPREDAVKPPAELQLAHVSDDPFLLRQTIPR